MDTPGEPAATLARPIPGFRAAPRSLLDPLPDGATVIQPATEDSRPATERTQPSGDPADSSAGLYGPQSLRPAINGTRTAISDSTGEQAPKPSLKDSTALVAGILGLVVVGVAWVVRLRRGAQLRRPSDAELDEVATPLARLARRHVPAGLLNADLADVIAAGAATGNYLNNGPLIEREYVDPGLPDGLNEETS